MITIKDHGIGTGKYKVGALINNGQILLDQSREYDLIWETPLSGALRVVSDSEGDAYVWAGDNISKFDLNGEPIWNVSGYSNPLRSYQKPIKHDEYDNFLYLIKGHDQLVKLDSRTGLEEWVKTIPRNGLVRSLAVGENYIAVASSGNFTNDKLYIIKKNGQDYSEIKEDYITDSVFTKDGNIAFLAGNGVNKYSLTGSKLWSTWTITGRQSSTSFNKIIEDSFGNIHSMGRENASGASFYYEKFDSNGSKTLDYNHNSLILLRGETITYADMSESDVTYLRGNQAIFIMNTIGGILNKIDENINVGNEGDLNITKEGLCYTISGGNLKRIDMRQYYKIMN